MDNDLVIYVSSDGASNDFPSNSPVKFSINFDIPLRLKTSSKNRWFICLDSIGISTLILRKTRKLLDTKGHLTHDGQLVGIPIYDDPKRADQIIKIKCLNIRSQIFNDSLNNDLAYITSFANGDFQYQEIENPVFLPILTNELTQLSFELTDLDNNLLSPKPEDFLIPTTLKLRLRKMNVKSKSFKLTISQKITREISDFTYILNKPLLFKENNWKVCLRSVSLPVSKPYFQIFYAFPNQRWQLHKVQIPNQSYDALALFEMVRDKLKLLPIEITERNNRIQIKARLEVKIIFEVEIARALGLCHECKGTPFKLELKEGQILKFDTMRPETLSLSLLQIECDIIDPEYFNDELVPILKLFNSEQKEHEILHFRNLEYKNISQKQISEINFKFNHNSKIPFMLSNGILFMELHFTNDTI